VRAPELVIVAVAFGQRVKVHGAADGIFPVGMIRPERDGIKGQRAAVQGEGLGRIDQD